jgi:hypothetical protein
MRIFFRRRAHQLVLVTAMVVIFTYSSSPSRWPLRSRSARFVALTGLGSSLTSAFVPVSRAHAQCVMGLGGAICPSSIQFDRGHSPGLGEVAPEMHSGTIGLSASRSSNAASVQHDMALPMQQRLEQSQNSGALRSSVGSSDGSIWSSEGVLFRLDEFQNSCSINRQGSAVRACN